MCLCGCVRGRLGAEEGGCREGLRGGGWRYLVIIIFVKGVIFLCLGRFTSPGIGVSNRGLEKRGGRQVASYGNMRGGFRLVGG